MTHRKADFKNENFKTRAELSASKHLRGTKKKNQRKEQREE